MMVAMDSDDGAGSGAPLSGEAFRRLFHTAPVAFLVIRADGLVMVEANQPYLDAVGKAPEEIVGKHVFDVFPNAPTRPEDQQSDLRSIMQSAIDQRAPVTVHELRYDIPVGDGFDVRWWNLTETPVVQDGVVTHLLHYTEDVTALHRARTELADTQRERDRSLERTARLAEVALALTGAQSADDLERIVVARGLQVLGADGGAVITRDPSGDWRVTLSEGIAREILENLDEPVELDHALSPYDSPLPGQTAARTGKPVILPDVASGVAFHPDMAELYEVLDRKAWACLPLTVGDRTLGAVAAGWIDEQQFTAADLEIMDGFAAQCAMALDRIEAAEVQRRTARRFQEVAESLQSAMLTEPTAGGGIEVAVRYRSANDVAQVGGDWYDSFTQPDGATMLAIGDVSGHDEDAAAKMGQIRGLLRALAYDAEDRPHGDSPATVLTRLEYVAQGLSVSELSTAILARIEDTDGEGRLLRWSNAGNAPPVVLTPDGETLLLDEKPDLLLGVDTGFPRQDHSTTLAPGSTLLLYTDGLIERRGSSIDVGIDDLCRTLAGLAGAPLGLLCDGVLEELAPHTGEDDIALVAVRV